MGGAGRGYLRLREASQVGSEVRSVLALFLIILLRCNSVTISQRLGMGAQVC